MPNENDPKVDFAVIGAQKSGTSALRHFLSKHPQIGLAQGGGTEMHYFSTRYVADQPGSYAAYHNLFTPDELSKTTGDVTPIYFYLNGSLDRMKAYNPSMKVIVLLRDPVKRAYSQWAMEHQRGKEKRSFVKALGGEALLALIGRQHPVRSYVRRGFYGHQLRRLFNAFPREQCLILRNDALKNNHEDTLRAVYDFLDVELRNVPPPETVHARAYPKIPTWTVRALRLLYRKDLALAEHLSGLDLSDWR